MSVSGRAFSVVTRTRANGIHNVVKYVSDRTGLSVVVADVEGPVVAGFICLATEAKTDDGLPHTLEHLIFMGSKRYPWKGCLDMVANRCFASGTNACTDTDHTYYDLFTAGSEGFLKLLPVYLDHIFHPMLTDDQFITEVHHVNGEGQDSGVVYSEMQEGEQDMERITSQWIKDQIYPPTSGYRFETGGRLLNLRTTCSNQAVQDFHSSFYHPRNTCVVVAGIIEHEKLLDTISTFEDTLDEQKKNLTAPWQRPFMDSIPALQQNAHNTIVCPSDDESTGEVRLAWLGPDGTDTITVEALQLLNEHLTSSPVSPFQRRFVQTADPDCSDVDISMYDQRVCQITVTFSGVQTEKLSSITGKCLQLMQQLCSGEESLDTPRLRDNIQQSIHSSLMGMERKPRSKLCDMIIGDFLHGEDTKHFEERLNDVTLMRELLTKDDNYWLNLMRTFYGSDVHYVAVVGKPSSELIEKQTNEESERIAKRRAELGESGLAECAQKLQQAITNNEKVKASDGHLLCNLAFTLLFQDVPTNEFLENCTVNSIDAIGSIRIDEYSNIKSKSETDHSGCAGLKLDQLPTPTILDGCKTNFVRILALYDTSHIKPSLRLLLLPLTKLMFQSPVLLSNGTEMPYEDVVKHLDRDLTEYDLKCGVMGSFEEQLMFKTVVYKDDHNKATDWLSRLTNGVQFKPDRIAVVLNQLVNNLAEVKRDADTMCQFVLNQLVASKDSNRQLVSLVRLERFLHYLLELLEQEPNEVVNEFQSLYTRVFAPNQLLLLHITCDVTEQSVANELTTQLNKLSESRAATTNGLIMSETGQLYSSSESPPELGKHSLLTVGSSDACYIRQVTRCHIDRMHADYPALRVALQAISQLEGPMWRMVRGKGLAYGAYVTYSKDFYNTLRLNLYRCAQPVQAYEKAVHVLKEASTSGDFISESDVESAKRSLIFELVEAEGTVHAASTLCLLSHLRGLEKDFNRRLCTRVWSVTVSDVQRAAQTYLTGFFDPQRITTAITCHPSKKDDIVAGLQRFDINVTDFDLHAAQEHSTFDF